MNFSFGSEANARIVKIANNITESDIRVAKKLALISMASGFTLIELLVVIAIVGILASIVLASVNSAKQKGSDAARKGDIKALETAMELYYSKNNTYPQDSTAGAGHPISDLSSYLVPQDIGSIASILTADGDSYVWGTANSYAFKVLLSDGSWCKTGVNVNAGWWGAGVPACSF